MIRKITRKIRNYFFYRKCEEWKKNEGFACYVCLAMNCFRNHWKDTIDYLKKEKDNKKS